jgi:lysyl-tRNA synthetase, class II
LILFTGSYLLLRSAQPLPQLTTDDEARLRALLDKYGDRDSLGYFALRRDKSVIWSQSRKSAVLYRVVSGVALASGDPVGDAEAWPGAINAFLDLARMHAWIPAVIGSSETGATAYRRAGLDALELGDEAIVRADGFSLDGRSMRGVRQAVRRLERAGYEVDVRRAADIPAAEMAELVRLSEVWRGAEVERGYSMALSRLGDAADGACVLATARREGELRGVLNFVPWGRDGLSLDLMRRDRTADNGLNELLIVRVIEAAGDLGVVRLSLNFAAFRSALERGGKIGAGPVLRLWHSILVFLSRWWQIESLYRFNLKFQPEWSPRFLSFPSSRDLLKIGIAALEAEAFITRPRRLSRLLRRPG